MAEAPVAEQAWQLVNSRVQGIDGSAEVGTSAPEPRGQSERGSSMSRLRTQHLRHGRMSYREAGSLHAPTIVLLHGFPSSSRMWQPLLERLDDRFHLLAPDLPGFGQSSPPPPGTPYTFDHLASAVLELLDVLETDRFHLVVQDYGGPVGMRLATARPEAIASLGVQNAVAHEVGLGPLWGPRREFWRDRAANENALRKNFFSPEATRLRHVGNSPNAQAYDPVEWTSEQQFLSDSATQEQQLDLFYDYQTNVARYPIWQAWLRRYQPPLQVLWGRYDPSFQVAEVAAYAADVPSAETHVLEGGHFVLDECADEVARLMRSFLNRTEAAPPHRPRPQPVRRGGE